MFKRISEPMRRKYEELRTFLTKVLHNFYSLPKITKYGKTGNACSYGEKMKKYIPNFGRDESKDTR